MCSRRSAPCTVWNVSWKPCTMRSISSVRRSPCGSSSTCRRNGRRATASSLIRRACRRTRVSAPPSPARSGPMAITSWTSYGLPSARRLSVPFPRWRRCGRSGCNNIIAVPSQDWKTSGGAPRTSNRPRRYVSRRPTTWTPATARNATTPWVGDKLHLTETCEPEHPDLITQVITTPSTTPDCTMGPTLVEDLAARDLLPGTQLLDSGYVDADFLVTAQQYQIDVVGPPFGSYSWQHKSANSYDLQAFVIAIR